MLEKRFRLLGSGAARGPAHRCGVRWVYEKTCRLGHEAAEITGEWFLGQTAGRLAARLPRSVPVGSAGCSGRLHRMGHPRMLSGSGRLHPVAVTCRSGSTQGWVR